MTKKSRRSPFGVAQSPKKLTAGHLSFYKEGFWRQEKKREKKCASAGIAQRQRRRGEAMRRTSAQRREEAAPLIHGWGLAKGYDYGEAKAGRGLFSSNSSRIALQGVYSSRKTAKLATMERANQETALRKQSLDNFQGAPSARERLLVKGQGNTRAAGRLGSTRRENGRKKNLDSEASWT